MERFRPKNHLTKTKPLGINRFVLLPLVFMPAACSL
jgi:hypothetical protein